MFQQSGTVGGGCNGIQETRRDPSHATLGKTLPEIGAKLTRQPHLEKLKDFRVSQLEGWKEQRRYGNPWRITDFVTIGSPLAHALLLLASNTADFKDRKEQRELPTCPPVEDDNGYGYIDSAMSLPASNKKYSPHILHHAAAFAVTRWTNLYFPAYGGLFGDFIGGPLEEVLGCGIHDIPVRSNSLFRFTPLTHTDYWETKRLSDQRSSDPECRDALEALKDTLGLDRLHQYRLDPPDQPEGTEPPDEKHRSSQNQLQEKETAMSTR